jgi:ElaB/YqjD/DUF883 family membrane-anchored ribosome-binding protein
METQHTSEMDKHREQDRNKDNARRGSESMASTGGDGMMGNRSGHDGGSGEGTLEQAKTMARNVGEQARNIANTASSTAQDLARQAREQSDTLYQQGTQASEYLARNVKEYPLTALLVAGAIGYGLGYLIHSGWTSEGWSGDERRGSNDRNANRRRHD